MERARSEIKETVVFVNFANSPPGVGVSGSGGGVAALTRIEAGGDELVRGLGHCEGRRAAGCGSLNALFHIGLQFSARDSNSKYLRSLEGAAHVLDLDELFGGGQQILRAK
uniref:Uncharacterized protein n=1 Tax=Pristionchus pacificus TaxID=54126 RepID=A0A2A6BP03_PRIPA|eukprot:PDM67568.1 hypothetical protein PRIPAC_48985 [Pristionchus pacificus]